MPPAVDAIGILEPKRYEFFQHCGDVPFEAQVGKFSFVDAWYLSDCSYLAYTEAPTAVEVEAAILPALTRMFGATPHVRVFLGLAHSWGARVKERAIQCIVTHSDDVGIVAFRGTMPHSLSNWLTDMDLLPVPEEESSEMLVHGGFKAALDCLWMHGESGGLEDYLTQVSNARPKIRWWFTGHSLGAALAALASRRFGRVHALYSYGSPRVGNRAFVSQLNRTVPAYYRIINHHDLFSRIPFNRPYVHGGQVIRVEEVSDSRRAITRRLARLSEPSRLPPNFEQTFRTFFNKLGQLERGFEDSSLLRAWLDHAPIFYSKLLWNQMIAEIGDRL